MISRLRKALSLIFLREKICNRTRVRGGVFFALSFFWLPFSFGSPSQDLSKTYFYILRQWNVAPLSKLEDMQTSLTSLMDRKGVSPQLKQAAESLLVKLHRRRGIATASEYMSLQLKCSPSYNFPVVELQDDFIEFLRSNKDATTYAVQMVRDERSRGLNASFSRPENLNRLANVVLDDNDTTSALQIYRIAWQVAKDTPLMPKNRMAQLGYNFIECEYRNLLQMRVLNINEIFKLGIDLPPHYLRCEDELTSDISSIVQAQPIVSLCYDYELERVLSVLDSDHFDVINKAWMQSANAALTQDDETLISGVLGLGVLSFENDQNAGSSETVALGLDKIGNVMQILIKYPLPDRFNNQTPWLNAENHENLIYSASLECCKIWLRRNSSFMKRIDFSDDKSMADSLSDLSVSIQIVMDNFRTKRGIIPESLVQINRLVNGIPKKLVKQN